MNDHLTSMDADDPRAIADEELIRSERARLLRLGVEVIRGLTGCDVGTGAAA